jgi:hypothetical protein
MNGSCVGGGGNLPTGGKLVFATSGEYSGNLGRVAGADSKCTAAATAAGLTGSFVAWISYRTYNGNTTVYNAIDRIADAPFYLTCPRSGAYVKAFNNRAHAQGNPLVRIDCNEFGQTIDGSNATTFSAWTGTATGGTIGSSTCNGGFAGDEWFSSGGSGTIGEFGTGASLTEWTSSTSISCTSTAHLYCFQL